MGLAKRHWLFVPVPKSQMNVVLAAEESPGLRLLQALVDGPHRLVAVLATPPKPDSAAANVWNTARRLGLETWPAERVKDHKLGERLLAERVDILLNVHSLRIRTVRSTKYECNCWDPFDPESRDAVARTKVEADHRGGR